MATLDGIGRAMAGQHPSLRWAYLLIAAALMIEMIVLGVGITVAFLADDYYGNTKAIRDVDEAGLLSDLGTIKAIGGWLEPLEFLGNSWPHWGVTFLEWRAPLAGGTFKLVWRWFPVECIHSGAAHEYIHVQTSLKVPPIRTVPLSRKTIYKTRIYLAPATPA